MNDRISEPRSLESRLRQLEATVQWQRRAGLTFALLLAAVVLMAQAAGPRSLEAQAFVVRDERGAARAQLGMSESSPALTLYDDSGVLRAALTVQADGPIFNLFTAEGVPRVVVGERGATAFVILRDADGAPRAAMAIQEDGSPSLYLLDEHMNPLFREPS